MQVDAKPRFDNFVVGSANRLAVAAAHAVADTPGAVYNPLFIYSGAWQDTPHARDRQPGATLLDPANAIVRTNLESVRQVL